MAHYVCNRRDCWGYVQGSAPLGVKRLIWEHESEELVCDPRVGIDHFTLATREARVLGLTADEIERGELLPGAVAAFWSWRSLAKDRPWLEAVAASCVLEIRNSSAVIRGGGLAQRIRKKLIEEAGLPAEQLINQSTHVQADVSHADLLSRVVEGYVREPEDEAAVMRGVRDSLIIDRAFRGALGLGLRNVESG